MDGPDRSLQWTCFCYPEYNLGPSAVLKNAIDGVYQEWKCKVAAFLSEGKVMGAREGQQLHEIAVELQMGPFRRNIVQHGRLSFTWHVSLNREKMGMIWFMRGLANDVASDSITANAVLPGLTNPSVTRRTSIGGTKTRNLGTTGDQAVGRA